MGFSSFFCFLDIKFIIYKGETMNINDLGLFYFTLAIIALAIAIVAYPLLNSRKKK